MLSFSKAAFKDAVNCDQHFQEFMFENNFWSQYKNFLVCVLRGNRLFVVVSSAKL